MNLQFRAQVADRDLEAAFEVAAGETVALLGPNGAGKSTILATLAGQLRPDAGEVLLGGRTLLSTQSRVDLAPHRRGVALLAQDPLLFPHLSVIDNVAFGARSRGTRRAQARVGAEAWLERVGIADLGSRKPSQLSGGQAQRAAVARALAAEPDLLLLDEPMAALDVAVRPELRQTLREVLADRTTVIVTHDVLDALLLADRVIVIEGGRIVEDGATAEVLARPRSAFAAQLAGFNLFNGTWQGDHVALADGTLLFGSAADSTPEPGAPVLATFRPGSVAVYRHAVAGSPRNSFDRRIDALEPLGDRLRVRCGDLSADVTLQAAAELGLTPGLNVSLTVKATEVALYAT